MFSVLEIVVIVAICVAIGSEVIAFIWTIVEMIKEKLIQKRKNEKELLNKKIAESAKVATKDIIDEPLHRNRTNNKIELVEDIPLDETKSK